MSETHLHGGWDEGATHRRVYEEEVGVAFDVHPPAADDPPKRAPVKAVAAVGEVARMGRELRKVPRPLGSGL